MSFFNNSLIFSFMLFNYVPAFIFGQPNQQRYYIAKVLYNEDFDARDGQRNWNLVHANPNLIGNSYEAKEYIKDLRELNEGDSRIQGAYLWSVSKNKRIDLKELRDNGFSDHVEHNKEYVRRTWNLGPNCSYWDSAISKEFAFVIHNWLENNEIFITEYGFPLLVQPFGITDWVGRKYDGL